jgi:threonine dehydrogenase-like Zn-dependent dehydrogenase
VAALGDGVTAFAVGDPVAAWRDVGARRQGCYAQYVPFQIENLLKIPADLALTQVTSLELAMCVQVSFNQLQKVDAVQGKRVGINGLGPAGLVALQMARAYGAAQVIAIDPVPARRALATQLGADLALAPDAGFWSTPSKISSETAFPLDTALDCTGLSAPIELLLSRTAETVALFGVLRDEVRFGWAHWRRGLKLLGYERHNRAAAEQALALVVNGKLNLDALATHSLPLTHYAEGVALLRAQEAVKVRFLPWGA